jgi:hypothetical protein
MWITSFAAALAIAASFAVVPRSEASPLIAAAPLARTVSDDGSIVLARYGYHHGYRHRYRHYGYRYHRPYRHYGYYHRRHYGFYGHRYRRYY